MRTASELALAARITPQTASTHLAKLTEAGLLSVVRKGRHRHFRLASPAVADMIDGIVAVALAKRPRYRPLSGDARALGDIETLPEDLRETLEEQRKTHGAPLHPYLFYARNPAYFRAAKAMFAALQRETTRVPGALRALLNRRVAGWNGCEF